MNLTIQLSTDGAAFVDDPQELDRVLADVAHRIRLGQVSGPLMDSNGNTCGGWALREGRPTPTVARGPIASDR